ncbi:MULTISPECIES: putative RNA methyltransferase [Rhodococcus]|uniref:Methyltransferase domain-containing protein n=1 Tax=Rhodococcus aetherivorans TaxID=191292 RepID=A0A059MT10_9NOCA|nr:MULTISPECIES: methyltransferase domain-containing protein [Rhodococcus]ETT26448.1 rRNA (guanine-N(1)-)-methyltransferase [Rhodococcus rhodochrous ATCC 21198]NCL73109.1 23S rRNA (guanine(748)-N(1))-methyltransferase [Rhodococcus sp. YH1]ANZ26033.1 methyltransferase type 11 [Rhodococcus sp. WB1]KDE14275.1 methyltransferase type 11 [Rhodococcus aetherivorans]MDV6292547.1 methyltransferase domain-containing protein [Rhodococcus aetherivorans]
MLDAVTDLLACPQCERGLDLDDGVLLCEAGHSFDVARQGYVSLLTGAATRFTGDTAEMIAARADFLEAGHYDPLRDAVARACAERPGGDGTARVLEVGAGTGRYLAAVLDALPGSRGVGLDVSKPAVRRIARSHPRVGAVLADVWRQWPIRSGVLSHVLSVFAPRNAAETHRVLAPGGVLVVAAPTPSHLRELVALPGMVQVDERKTERLGAALSGAFERVDRADVQYTLELDRPALGQLAGMGPSGHHLTAERLAELVSGLPEPFPVTASVTVTVWERRATH